VVVELRSRSAIGQQIDVGLVDLYQVPHENNRKEYFPLGCICVSILPIGSAPSLIAPWWMQSLSFFVCIVIGVVVLILGAVVLSDVRACKFW
jgi:hypothetical protein